MVDAPLDIAPPRIGHTQLGTGAVVQVRPPLRAVRFYRHGWQSWSDTRWIDPALPPVVVPVPELRALRDDPVHAGGTSHGGSGVGAIETPDGNVLLLGALSLGGRVELEDGMLRGSSDAGPGDWFVSYGDEQRVFAGYADELARRFGARKVTTPRVWCSWYSFHDRIGEQEMHAILDDLEGLPFDCVQLDDGWQREIGVWEPNARFPSGMRSLADRIHSTGRTAGLWLAPFIAHARAPMVRQRPDLFLRDDDGAATPAGNNWGGAFYALDLTHPDAREWIADRIRAAVGWGFGYLKLDFLYAGALPGRRWEDVPREHAYRSGIELVRDAAGDDVYLLACGAPILPSLGVFDGIRVSPDVSPWWENDVVTRYLNVRSGTRHAICSTLHRLWLRPVIDVDPDVAYFRTRYNLLSADHRRLLQCLAHVAGFRATSDPPAWLDPGERDELLAFLTADPVVRRLGRYRFAVDDREVDFGEAVDPPPEYRGP